jgi:hypothetical protein
MRGATRPLGAEGGSWLAHWRQRRATDCQGYGPASPLATNEEDELEDRFHALDTEGTPFARRLALRLQPLVCHGVPPRCIEAAPVPRAARLRFADGTTVIVKGVAPGDIGELALALSLGPVRLAACEHRPDGSTYLVLKRARRSRELSLRVLGFDQPD